MKAFQAYASGCTATATTARQAAEKFFSFYPNKRKCSVIEGHLENGFFAVAYGRASEGKWPFSACNVTKKLAQTLPNEPKGN
jgi:transposase